MSEFEEAYRAGTPPWDIGRPQPAFVALEEAGSIEGSVLDVGCGTGEHVLFLASRGHDAWGVDAAPTAIETAREKARARGIRAEFHVQDALRLEALGRTFDTVTDSGLFHVFGDADRPRYAASLARVLRPNGVLYILCFSEKEPGVWGPRRVTQEEIRDAFKDAWHVASIHAASFATNLHAPDAGAWAWLATMVRR